MRTGFIVFVLCLIFASCSREDDLSVTPTLPEYDLSDSDTDLIQKERYKLYRDYGVILIDSVKPSDYRYTMTGSSPVRIVTSLMDTTQKLEAIRLLRKILYDAFPKQHIVDGAPLKCIIGNRVYERDVDPTGGETIKEFEAYLSDSYFAFTINQNILNSEKRKEVFTTAVVSEFVIKGLLERRYTDEDYMDLFKPMFLGDKDEEAYGFYVIYGDTDPDVYPGDPNGNRPDPADYPYEDFFKIEDIQAYAYENGLVSVTTIHGNNGFPGNPALQVDVYMRPEDYLPSFLTWSLLNSDEEKEMVLNTYPRFKERYEVICELLLKYADLDLKEM